MRYALDWSPLRQVIEAGEIRFVHDGLIPTRAEHDVAHLMIAHNGGMLWRPEGPREEVCQAEFNSVHLEMLLIHAIEPSEARFRQASVDVLQHMQWFAEQHYAPFPITTAAALVRFWQAFKPARVLPMMPLFQRVRRADQSQRILDEIEVA